jgi:hypothetical protein
MLLTKSSEGNLVTYPKITRDQHKGPPARKHMQNIINELLELENEHKMTSTGAHYCTSYLDFTFNSSIQKLLSSHNTNHQSECKQTK